MKDEQKWMQNIRNRMDDYSEPLPSDMWKRVEKSLDTPKVIPMWRRWQAVAAVGLIAVVSSLTCWFWFSPAADLLEHQGRQLAQQEMSAVLREERMSLSVAEPMPVVESETEMVAVVMRQDGKSLSNKTVSDGLMCAVQPVVQREEESVVADSKSLHQEDEKQLDSDGKKEVKTRRAMLRADRERMKKNAQHVEETHSAGSRSVQFGVAAGNIPYSSSSSFGGFGRMASRTFHASGDLLMNAVSDKSTAYSQVLFNNREQTPVTDIHHRMPVTAGASVKWNLKKGWALETGLTYTILSSESHAGSQASYMEEEWKLHYIGIPLKVHRSIWESKHFHIYASAGGAVEKSVSGNLETVYVTGTERESESSSLHVSELQWSVSAAAGAQVNFTPSFGFYVEPGVAYYFDDGSDVETFRKDHPLSFNLQLGLRFSFGK